MNRTVYKWNDIVATQQYQRNPNPAMLDKEGWLTSGGKAVNNNLVQFDRSYVVSFIKNKFVNPLVSAGLDVLTELMKEAYNDCITEQQIQRQKDIN